MPQPPTFDERFIEAFENVAECVPTFATCDADVRPSSRRATLIPMCQTKTDVSVLQSDVSIDVSVSLTCPDSRPTCRGQETWLISSSRGDIAAMEGRLHAHVNRQAWMTISVMATLMVASVGLTGYFVKILA